MTRIYLIRHAQAAGNLTKTFQGSIDAPLSPLGLEQLDCLAQRFSTVSFDRILTSPLSRAYQTAQAVNRAWNREILVEPRFTEIDGGAFEGVAFSELPQRFPRENQLWVQDQPHFQAPGGESMEQVYHRVGEGLADALSRYAGETLVITSHGCALRNLLCILKGFPLCRIGEVEWLENTSVTLAEFVPGQPPKLCYVGDCSHLTPEMRRQTHLYFGGAPSQDGSQHHEDRGGDVQ